MDLMKIKLSLSVFFLLLVTATGYGQEKSKKRIREEQKIEKQKQIATLVNAKEFVFIGRTALPQGFRTMDLTTNPNYVEFHSNKIKSEMPFFGTAYSGVAYGSDGGLKFEGIPQEFTIVNKKKAYQIETIVKGETDVFRLFLSVSFAGTATLTISSNNRSTISYIGEIRPIEKMEIK